MKKKTLKCREVYNIICDSLDENLNSPKCVELRHHLKNCSNCKANLDSLKKTITLYRKYPEPRISNSIYKTVLQKLKLKNNRKKK